MSQPTTPDEEDDGMDVDSDVQSEAQDTQLALEKSLPSRAILLRDAPDWLALVKVLPETEVIILLTPVVIPISQDPTDTTDPFEILGRALARRHARIRQIPYTQRNGITSTHLGFIKRGNIIILCFSLRQDQDLELEIADIVFAVSDNKPCIITVHCSNIKDDKREYPFPTVILTDGYSPAALEETAALIFSEISSAPGSSMPAALITDPTQPRLWPVEDWNESRDIANVYSLWTECISIRFAIDQYTLGSLLRRPGYAKHYVVRDPFSGELLGFCATYLSYVDQEGENLIASLALLIVRPSNRLQGIGLSLHSHAITQLKRTRGVKRLQLGSTFPRILYGLPFDMLQNEEWFHRRGWQLDKNISGLGRAVHDLVLDFADWNISDPSSALMPGHRLCSQEDMGKVLGFVEKCTTEQVRLGWLDQYLSLINGPNVKDIVLSFDGDALVATAITYTPSCGSQVSTSLPWASKLGNNVGGVTCICVNDTKRDAIMPGLIDACVKNLRGQGMSKLFVDATAEGLDTFTRLNFKEWARYKDVWKDT